MILTTWAFTLKELRAFVQGHREALLCAVELPDSPPGLRLAMEAVDGFAAADIPSRRTMRLLDDLLGLLMLEHVHDPDQIEAASFAAIDLARPVVEEICLLADGLNEALAEIRGGRDARRTYTHLEVAA
ncbi:hypothetical protein [Limimaricola cinnabarinus]|uniref:hypothetical protein n=1 Tax=Limimaricola cinnabarinus TaxID=1125964 RepID=UPI002493A521|nr:hypothetical protein [Limimaricola cinnabarinus]